MLNSSLTSFEDFDRRRFMATTAKSLFGVSILPVGAALANNAPAASAGKAKQVIYLYMSGAMSHLDTFDPKPKSKTQGETGVIKTAIPGVQFGEYFENLAKQAKDIAVVRSMTTTTGAHEQARYLLRTSYKKIATTKHPGLGSWVQKFKGRIHKDLPPTVQIGGGVGPGYLGAQYAPVPIGDPSKGLENTKSPSYLSDNQFDQRMKLSNAFEKDFRGKAKNAAVKGYDELYNDAIRLLKSKDLKAFNIYEEPKEIQEAYGTSRFGRGVLLARRLVESGVRFVEVSFGSWDMHNGLWDNMPDKAGELDRVVGTLLKELKAKGKLDETLVVIGTEFGRKPNINQNAGRDHHPAAFSCMMAGGGVKGGRVYGATDEEGFHVNEDPVSIGEFNATIATLLGIPHKQEIRSPDGRPFTIGNGEDPIKALV